MSEPSSYPESFFPEDQDSHEEVSSVDAPEKGTDEESDQPSIEDRVSELERRLLDAQGT